MTAPKIRIYELSKTLGVSNAEVMDALEKDFGVKVKSHSSSLEQDIADKLIAKFKGGKPAGNGKGEEKAPAKKAAAKPAAKKDKTEDPEPEKVPTKPAAKAKPEPEMKKAERKPEEAPKAPEVKAAEKPETKPEPKKAEPPAAARAAERPMARPAQHPAQPGRPPEARPQQPAAGLRPAQRPGTSQPYPPRPGQGQPGGMPAGARPAYHPQQQQQRPSNQGKSRRQLEYEKIAAIRRQKEEEEAAIAAQPKIVRIDEPIVVRDLAALLRLRDTELIKHLFMKGMMVTVNQTLDVDFAKSLAREFEFEVEEEEKASTTTDVQYTIEARKKLDEKSFKNLQGRSPVISIMGHVDHGKTTLLDAIRETRHKVVDTEAGGITQSIGAYTVEKEGHRIVFLDTPGHEAFTSMRMRGAQATDIAILVVAADDGVMPQTKEAISHAKAAQIPIIVAVNKIDKADADPDKVLIQLADYGLAAEKWGGDTLTVEVSALQKLGIDDLLDSILLVSELLELKADPTVPGEGVIIEAQLDKRMGPVATALVQNGSMKVGDNVLIGSVGGRVRALIDDHGKRVQKAGPATPVEIMGLNGVPNAGETFRVITDDKQFKQLLNEAKIEERSNRLGVNKAALAGVSGPAEEDARKEQQFTVLVKADTQGSLEAVVDVLQRLSTDEVKINIVHSGTGDVSEADVMLASTASALVIAFNVKEDPNALRLVEQHGVTVKKYDVIYHITEEMEKWVLGQLSPETSEVEAGTAEVRQIFKVGKNNVIAGCMVTSGKMIRNAKAVVLRDGREIFTGTMDNLKRFKDDAKEVASGYECGISFDKFNDIQEGDIITVYTTKQLERTSF